MAAKKGDWVRVHTNVLEVGQRAPQVPDDTKKVPLEMWTKGALTEDAEIGDKVSVITTAGREQVGELVEVGPYYRHNFGHFVPEIIQIDQDLRGILSEEENGD